MEQQTEKTLPHFAKGKRPQFYDNEVMDEAMSMILVLASEFSVMRDRMDTIEKIADSKGIVLEKEIEEFEPDEATSQAREERRQALLERLYYLTMKRADEQNTNDSEERYFDVLDKVAKG